MQDASFGIRKSETGNILIESSEDNVLNLDSFEEE